MELAARILMSYELCHATCLQLAWQLNAGVEWRNTIVELTRELQELGNLLEEYELERSAPTSGSNSHVTAVESECHTGNLPD